jgi:hypothetical protein
VIAGKIVDGGAMRDEAGNRQRGRQRIVRRHQIVEYQFGGVAEQGRRRGIVDCRGAVVQRQRRDAAGHIDGLVESEIKRHRRARKHTAAAGQSGNSGHCRRRGVERKVEVRRGANIAGGVLLLDRDRVEAIG